MEYHVFMKLLSDFLWGKQSILCHVRNCNMAKRQFRSCVLVFKPGTTRLNCVWSVISSRALSVSSWGIRLPSLRALLVEEAPLPSGSLLERRSRASEESSIMGIEGWVGGGRVWDRCSPFSAVLNLEACSVISSDQNEDLRLAASVLLSFKVTE